VKLTWLHDFTRFENWQPTPYDEFGDAPPDDF
jgi:hypothetical protein